MDPWPWPSKYLLNRVATDREGVLVIRLCLSISHKLFQLSCLDLFQRLKTSLLRLISLDPQIQGFLACYQDFQFDPFAIRARISWTSWPELLAPLLRFPLDREWHSSCSGLGSRFSRRGIWWRRCPCYHRLRVCLLPRLFVGSFCNQSLGSQDL